MIHHSISKKKNYRMVKDMASANANLHIWIIWGLMKMYKIVIPIVVI